MAAVRPYQERERRENREERPPEEPALSLSQLKEELSLLWAGAAAGSSKKPPFWAGAAAAWLPLSAPGRLRRLKRELPAGSA